MSKNELIEKPTVKLVGEDGNAFSIIGRVSSALQCAGYSKEYIKQFQNECMSSDYDNLLQTCIKYVNVE